MSMKIKAAALLLVTCFAFVKPGAAQDSSKVSSLLLHSVQAQNTDSSFRYAEEAFAEAQRVRDARSIALTLIRRGELKGKRKDPYGSLRDLTEAVRLGDSLRDKPVLASAYRQLADLYAYVYNFPVAYNYQRLHYETRDSLLREELAAQAGRVQAAIDSAEAKREEAIAQNASIVKSLESELADSKRWTALLGGAALLLALSLTGLLFYKRRSKAAPSPVAPAPVTPSPVAAAPVIPQPVAPLVVNESAGNISYAQSLHSSLLPGKEYLAAHLPEHFVVNQQGSDLHWAYSPAPNEILIAAACSSDKGSDAVLTSVLAGTMLNSIVRDRKVHHPNLALNVLRDNLAPLLNVNAQQRIDLVLCRINFEKMLMSFSSSDALLWILRGSDILAFEVEQLSIGLKSETVKAFPMKNVELLKGDIIYISTCDRSRVKELQALLYSVKDEPMSEQRDALASAFSEPGDFTVIGIRI